MRKKEDLLLEEAYSKVVENFNSERQFRASMQNLQSRGFKVAYQDATNDGNLTVLANFETGELIFIEVDASHAFKAGYVLTTDQVSKIVKAIRNNPGGFDNLDAMLTDISSFDSQIVASAMHSLKSFQDVFAQINKRDSMNVDVSSEQ